ncbi:ATP synthase mitochondrial F1 complex assembly factor 2 homolog l(2)k14505 [Arctopsyche grandis]|uniref:ATP synthase mitochondrial F1 complex assembly factor 2 homolog l(2)k14505 n=1 Tax=Arctopsyche grandis TaxID=121162 RepID=UPI00406D9933
MFKWGRTASLWGRSLACKYTSYANYATTKKFFKNTGIIYSDGRYEITLDQRKLKTPSGRPFYVESEPLALAISEEWDSQRDTVQRSSMHLTSLCSTALDNPNHLTKFDLANYLINYLTTDTLLFQSHDDDALYEMQQKEWDPIIQWFCDRFAVNMKKVRGFDAPTIDSNTKSILTRHLLSYDFAAVHGYTFGVDTLKSVILMLAAVERQITAERAVYLSRLEEEFQCGYWGRVEWSHDLSQQDLQSRLSAAMLIIHFQSSNIKKQSKGISV